MLASFFIRILALPVVESKVGFGQGLKRMLWFWNRLLLLFLFVGLFRFGFGGCFGSLLLFGFILLLLLGWLLFDGFVDEGQLVHHCRINGLVVDGSVPAGHVRILLTPFLIEEVLEAPGHDLRGKEICQRQPLPDKEGINPEMLLKHLHALKGSLL